MFKFGKTDWVCILAGFFLKLFGLLVVGGFSLFEERALGLG
jgi:hypothetical protein